ncbi:hypothetical protein GCM10008018_06340 [Paenibacillus marchantiophytorum]|uniref:Uncharacterized protein n=1 Tax=Paenibacillus marchantiophytorum TaxID=1619310 RepID=A0ABQ2BP36_9BACL|nr:hypothetical protein [Paenibacillus marchantiophytorum]GGI44285.1 hypothetical protein GCM10008018_06340 [Paenibacillus marchantiophytorum]
MKKTKWTKWQLGIVIAAILFYLFQEVKASPQFLAAVTAASLSQGQKAPVTVQKETDTTRVTGRTNTRIRNQDQAASGRSESSPSTKKAHTRSQAS